MTRRSDSMLAPVLAGALIVVAVDFAGAFAFFGKWRLASVCVIAARLGGPVVLGMLVAARGASRRRASLLGALVGAAGLPVALGILTVVYRLSGKPGPLGRIEPRMALWILSAGVLGLLGAFLGAVLAGRSNRKLAAGAGPPRGGRGA